jgi:hypothetical protein
VFKRINFFMFCRMIRTVVAKLIQEIGCHTSEMDECINVDFRYVIAVLSSYSHIKCKTSRSCGSRYMNVAVKSENIRLGAKYTSVCCCDMASYKASYKSFSSKFLEEGVRRF